MICFLKSQTGKSKDQPKIDEMESMSIPIFIDSVGKRSFTKKESTVIKGK